MSTAFDSIQRGLLQAIEHAEGRAPDTRIHRPRPVDVKALRAKVGMTQEQFELRLEGARIVIEAAMRSRQAWFDGYCAEIDVDAWAGLPPEAASGEWEW